MGGNGNRVIGRKESDTHYVSREIDALIAKIFDGKPSEEELNNARRRFDGLIDSLIMESLRSSIPDRYTVLIKRSEGLHGIYDNKDQRPLSDKEVEDLDNELRNKFFERKREIVSI